MAFIASAFAISVTLIAAAVPAINVSGSGNGGPQFPAPPGYLLPWEGGRIHSVTQGEETTFTHNGMAAYAYDFDLNYDTVVAARGGKVTMIREDSNLGGCNAMYSSWTNYVVIDHGDGTSGLYLHLAHDSVTVEPGQVIAQGDPIAISGETGVTCADGDDGAPGPHLHFQVQLADEGHYFTQSLPVAFDDIPENQGVPVEGESHVSGNFGSGKPQKIKLTPYRVPRVFNPTAKPADPTLLEAPPAPPPPPEASPAAQEPGAEAPAGDATATDTPQPLIETLITPEPTDTATPPPTATPTPTAAPSDTPTPLPTDTPVPTVGAAATEPPATTEPGATSAPASQTADPGVVATEAPSPPAAGP